MADQKPARDTGFGDPLETNLRYEKIEDINNGAFGFVQKCFDKISGEYVAVKFIRRNEVLCDKFLEREIENHCQLQHPFIIGLKDCFLTDDYLVIVMELADAGDLYEHVIAKGGLSETSARTLFQQFIYGLQYCHSRGIVNRDVKLENTLLKTSGNGFTVKICDFGTSKNQLKGSKARTRVGSPQYMAPEVIQSTTGSTYDGQVADMWSCGVMLYVMVMARYPFSMPNDKTNPGKVFGRMLEGFEGAFHMKESLSTELKDLVKGLMAINTLERLTIDDVMNHPWFIQDLPASLSSVGEKCPITKSRHVSATEVAGVIASIKKGVPPLEPDKPSVSVGSCLPPYCSIC